MSYMGGLHHHNCFAKINLESLQYDQGLIQSSNHKIDRLMSHHNWLVKRIFDIVSNQEFPQNNENQSRYLTYHSIELISQYPSFPLSSTISKIQIKRQNGWYLQHPKLIQIQTCRHKKAFEFFLPQFSTFSNFSFYKVSFSF